MAMLLVRIATGLRAAGWLVATLVLGSLALLTYAFVASLRASDPVDLLLGPHRTPAAGR